MLDDNAFLIRSRRKRKLPMSHFFLPLALLSVLGLALFPTKLSAFLVAKSFPQRTSARIPPVPLWAMAQSVQNNNSENGSSSSPIDQANEALKNLDVQSAESFLMMAVAEVNGAVMNNPPLLRCFEDLFRTKIKIAQNQESKDDVAYAIAQDRMGLASLLTDQSKYQEAADELELAVRSLSLLTSSRDSRVLEALDKASSLLFRTRAMVCDWDEYDQSCNDLSKSTQSALEGGAIPAVHPFEALAWPCLSLRDATGIAQRYGARAMGTSATNTNNVQLPWRNLEDRLPRKNVPFVRAVTESSNTPKPQTKNIIKVGYLSPDFTGRHPLAFLMQDVFRFHDTSRFEIVLYSLGEEPDGSPEVERILHGRNEDDEDSRTWKTLRGSIETMAQTIFEDNLDVVIDLCGYTGTSLVAEVMARMRSLDSPAKAVHVAYMGFPGSSGAPYIDYMIADAVVIPSKFRPWYTENILFMPHCYFVNSHWHIKQATKNTNPCKSTIRDRAFYGLPPSPVFVFCCHSRPDKIDPSTFRTWIRALKRTRTEGRVTGDPAMANAVLWLLRSTGAPEMEGNLVKVARTILGDDTSGIVFCDQAPRDEHLERLALADLYLDTPAYNAHTVGCDCLSAGVPMISMLRPWHRPTESDDESSRAAMVPTEKLASRVGASLLRSAGSSSLLSDALVVSCMEEYENRMVECAASSGSGAGGTFASLQQHLLEEFGRAPLWDTGRWVRNLETGLATMVDLQRKGFCGTDIYVMDYNDADTNM